VEPLPFEGIHVRGDLTLSPDGERVAVTRWAGGETQIWIYDLARGTQEKLTGEGVHHGPAWHPDGKHVAYTALVDGTYDIWWSAVDGSRPPAALVATSRDETSVQWSPDGHSVVFEAFAEQTGADLELLPLDAPEQRRSLVATTLHDSEASISRDGRWLAYRSGADLYVSAFPGTVARTLISSGADTPRWSRATDELFFVKDEELMAVRLRARGESFEVEPPRALFTVPRGAGRSGSSPPASGVRFDTSADGRSFLFLLPLEGQSQRDEIHVRLNGFEELKNLDDGDE
jgi:dipeptidyl aminopeptidase/acylaminoacyl peptidase